MPQAESLVWPTLQAIVAVGGSARVPEISDWISTNLALPEEVQATPHGDGPQTEVDYRLAWARTYLKKVGALENSSRGVWTATDLGRGITDEETALRLIKDWRARAQAERVAVRAALGASADEAEPAVDEGLVEIESESWREQLLNTLLKLSPDAFERLASRLLREAGFVNITVTGRTGDQGIDGTGIYQLSLVSFPVFFQCKRYAGSVGSGEIRDFRGAMQGRGGSRVVADNWKIYSRRKGRGHSRWHSTAGPYRWRPALHTAQGVRLGRGRQKPLRRGGFSQR